MKQNIPRYFVMSKVQSSRIPPDPLNFKLTFFFLKLLQNPFRLKMNVIEKQFNNATDALNNLQSCLEEVSMLICQEQNITCNIRWLPLHDSFASFLSKDRRKEYTKVLKWQRSLVLIQSTLRLHLTAKENTLRKHVHFSPRKVRNSSIK